MPDIRQQAIVPVGYYVDVFEQAIGADDFEPGYGFLCTVLSAGTLDFKTTAGEADRSKDFSAGDDVAGAGGMPVILEAIRGSSTVNLVEISVPVYYPGQRK